MNAIIALPRRYRLARLVYYAVFVGRWCSPSYRRQRSSEPDPLKKSR